MRHRITDGVSTGMGNPSSVLMDNQWSGNKSIDDAVKTIGEILLPEYFAKYQGSDFQIIHDSIQTQLIFGIEPAYKFNELIIITIHSDIGKCSIRTGMAFDFYGSGIRSRIKHYSEYKRMSCKFVRLIDQCHEVLMNAGGGGSIGEQT